MDAGKATISGVFNGSRLLEIPFYQRAYVWGEEQWERFLGDMEFVTASKRPYFLGSIICLGLWIYSRFRPLQVKTFD